jgi:hypothetical protein
VKRFDQLTTLSSKDLLVFFDGITVDSPIPDASEWGMDIGVTGGE